MDTPNSFGTPAFTPDSYSGSPTPCGFGPGTYPASQGLPSWSAGGWENSSGNISCSGPITATFTWITGVPALPVPTSVIVEEICDANWGGPGGPGAPTGGCSNPLGGSSVPALQSTGADWTCTKYSTQPVQGKTVTTTCSPQANVTVPSGGFGGAGVVYAVQVYPVSINPVGAILDSSGNWDILIGQGCAPTLNGIPAALLNNTVHPPTYVWTVSGSTFQSWSPTTPANPQATPPTLANPNASYYVDGPGPLNGPAPNSTPAVPPPHWYWHDSKQTTETITCTATVTPPAGQGSAFTVMAMQNVIVMVPDFTASGAGGYIQVNPYAPGSNYELWAGPTSQEDTNGQKFGMNWTLSVATPTKPAFGLGKFELIQITTPNDSYTIDIKPPVSRTDPLNNIVGFDGSAPAVSSPESAQGVPLSAGDSPGLALRGNTFQAASASFSPSFTDYLMYQPPGTDVQWVPLAQLPWSASGSAQIPITDNWADYSRIHGSDSAGTVNPSTQTDFKAKNTFPSWTHIDTAKPY